MIKKASELNKGDLAVVDGTNLLIDKKEKSGKGKDYMIVWGLNKQGASQYIEVRKNDEVDVIRVAAIPVKKKEQRQPGKYRGVPVY